MFSGDYDITTRGKIGQDIWLELGDTDLVFFNPVADLQVLQYKWEFEQFLKILDQRHFSTVLEIGSWSGGSLYEMMKRADRESVVLSISDDMRPGYMDRLHGLNTFQHDLNFIVGNSHDSVSLEKARNFFSVGLDLLFIDGDHSYQGSKQDFMDYGPLVNSGGLIALQDIVYSERCYTVRVNELWKDIREAGYKIQELYTSPTQGGLGIGIIYV